MMKSVFYLLHGRNKYESVLRNLLSDKELAKWAGPWGFHTDCIHIFCNTFVIN